MADFDKEINDISTGRELDDMKRRLFREKVSLAAEKNELQMQKDELKAQRKVLAQERRQLERETRQLSIKMNELKESAEFECRRLREDEDLLSRKKSLIENAYKNMEQDKKNIRREYEHIERTRENLRRAEQIRNERKEVYATGLFFRGVNNPIALKKRYKDLMKIYHPDNMCGDHRVCDMINEEYNILLRQFDSYMKA